MSDQKARRTILKILRIFSWIVLSIIGLLVLVALAVQIPWVQNKIKQEAIGFLENKIGTRVELARFSLSFPKKIVIEGFYMEDQQKDTLLYAGRLGIDTDLWGLTDNTIELNSIELSDFTARVARSERDSAFNFDYILAAFASDTTAVVDTTAAPWKFVLGSVALGNLRLQLEDSLSGNHARMRLEQLDVSMEKFDLDSSIVAIDNVDMAGLSASIRQTKIPETLPDSVEVIPEDSAATPFNIGFNEISLSRIDLDYEHTSLGQRVNLSLPEGRVNANAIDLKEQLIDLERVLLRNAYVAFEQLPVSVAQRVDTVRSPAANPPDAQQPWQFALGEFNLSGMTVQFDNYNEKPQKGAVDFNHLWLTNVNSIIRNVRYTGDQIQANVNQFAFREKSGFRLNAFRSSLYLHSDSLGVRNFYLRTDHTTVKLDARARYRSLESLANNPQEAFFAFTVEPSVLGVRDLLYFNPAVLDSMPVTLEPTSIVRLDAHVHGTLADLSLERLQVHALKSTSLFANGKLRDVMNPDRLRFDVYVDRLYTTQTDIRSLLPDTLIPPSIALPGWLSLKGHYTGSLQAPDTKTNLTSDFGRVDLHAKLNLDKSTRDNYRGEVVLHDFHMGKLLKQDSVMGRLDMVAAVNGAGVTLEDLDALFKVRVNRFRYSGYTYRDFRLDGSMKKYFFSGKASLPDENLNFVLTGDLDYNNEVPKYRFELDVKNADLRKLKLTPRPMKMRGQIAVDLETPDFRKLNGNLDIRKFAMFNGQELYSVDSLLFASIDQEGQSEITIKSDIMSGEFKGTINLFSLGDVLGRHVNRYFTLSDTTYAKPLDKQQFKFDLVIKNTDLITEILVPELEPFVPGKISGEFDSEAHELDLDIRLAEINYSGIAFDTINFKVISDPRSLDFTLRLQEILVDTVNIKTVRLAANIMNDSIRTNFMILDSLGQEKYFIGGVVNNVGDVTQFSFLKNQLMLNYEEWSAPLYNSLRFTDRGLDPNNFYIQKENERILLLKKNNADSTLSLAFREVDLKNITSMVEGTTPLGGLIDGEVTLASAEKGSFETSLSIRQLEILEQQWGNLSLLMKKSTNTPMNFKLDLKGEHAELYADGFMGMGDDPDMLMRARLPRLNLAIAEPLTMGQAKNLTGALSGQLTMMGKTKDPQISGELNFRNTNFLSTFTNTAFSIENETLFLRDEDLVFDRFEIMDDKRNKAVLDGLVSSNPKGGFDLRLNLNARNFQLFNTTEKDNELFYGKVWLNTQATITGNSFQPVIRMDVSLANQSELTYVVPQSEKGIIEQQGIVVFIDKDAVNDPFMTSINPEDTVKAGFTGMDLTANIELTDQERFNVVIDPVTGDRLSVKGNSTLTLHMDPTGDMQLSGRYEITEGTYDLSFAKFVKRNFAIDKGSTITWTGDPMNGQMDIRAIYTVETAPIDLVSNIYVDADLSQFKKTSPFQVYLMLKGELLFPEIAFRLDMPPNERDEYGGSVYPILLDINQRESDVNKQVFALLILKRFISDNPFESEGGGSLAGSARKSVSKLLSEQLNRLSSNVKGIELSFDVNSYEDYSRGGQAQTDLELGLSKSLMNDRLVVKVSGNVNVEGETNEQSSITDFIGDLALEYKLTEDGRFRVTGFRNSNYDMIDGDLIETGAGLIYIKDYDSLKELFKPNAKN